MKTAPIISVLTVLCLIFPRITRAEIVERIAAIVNNDVITLSELDEVIDGIHEEALRSMSDPKERESKRDELRKDLLDQMIDQRILSQQYEKLQISASEKDIDDMVDAICRQNKISLDILKSELKRQGLTFTEYREQMRQHILQSKFIEQQIRPRISISEEDVKQLYTKQIGELTTQEVAELVGVLVVLPKGGSPEAIEAARKKAATIQQQLMAGVTPGDIASGYSDGSVTDLGNMGRFARGELMEPLNDAVFKLKQGEVTAPIETAQGLFIIRMESLRRQAASDAQPFEEVQEQLYQRFYNEQVENQLQIFVRNARKDAHVEILL